MEKLITYENLKYFTYSNDKDISCDIKGIAISFGGLGHDFMTTDSNGRSRLTAQNGIIYLLPYDNPWSWMNRQAIDFTDEIIDVLFEHYCLDEQTPIVASGGSMGGLSAIVYSYYSKRTPIACITNCPVCDLVYHYSERDGLPRTLYSAFYNEEGNMFDVLKKYSPIHLAEKLPDIEYKVFSCDNDELVSKKMHSDAFAEKMKFIGKDIETYLSVNSGHCDLNEETMAIYNASIIDAIIKR